MSNIFGRCFFKFYPSRTKHADTQAGVSLRRVLGVSLFLHICFFITALTAIGFKVMLLEIFFVSWVYSCYLTLHEWAIVVYLITLVFGITHGFLSIFAFTDVSLLFFILLLVFYFLSFYGTGTRYLTFRAHGGIHGNIGRVNKPNTDNKAKLIPKSSSSKRRKDSSSSSDSDTEKKPISKKSSPTTNGP
jgi:hypothetical protein